MTPFVRIIANGRDITDDLTDRLISIEVRDEAGSESDRVTIMIDDRPRSNDAAIVAIPAIGLIIEIIMGYVDGESASMGIFLIDDITVDAPPRTLTINGRAAAMPRDFRTPRTKSYHQTTIGEIVDEVAVRSGYRAVIDDSLSGIVVRHVDQHHESDMAFVSRLLADHDGFAKPVAGRLAVSKRGAGSSASGAELQSFILRESDCQLWRFNYSARDEAGEAEGLDGAGSQPQRQAGDSRLPQVTQFQRPGGVAPLGPGPGPGQRGGVRAFWNDIRTGEQKEVTIGDEPFHDLRYTYHNEAEARAAVDTYKNTADRGKASFSCAMGGNVRVQAEAKLILEGFRPYIPTEWRIKSVTHRYEPGGGYTTTPSVELFAPAQSDVAGDIRSTRPTRDDLIDDDAPQEPVIPSRVPPRSDEDSEYIIQLPQGTNP